MCSPVEGPRRTETSHSFIKSLELKCHVHIFLPFAYMYMYIHIYTHIYIYIYIHIYIHIYIYIPKDLGSKPSECHIFYLFRCVLSFSATLAKRWKVQFRLGLAINSTTLILITAY